MAICSTRASSTKCRMDLWTTNAVITAVTTGPFVELGLMESGEFNVRSVIRRSPAPRGCVQALSARRAW